jgi:hypothetical protein
MSRRYRVPSIIMFVLAGVVAACATSAPLLKPACRLAIDPDRAFGSESPRRGGPPRTRWFLLPRPGDAPCRSGREVRGLRLLGCIGTCQRSCNRGFAPAPLASSIWRAFSCPIRRRYPQTLEASNRRITRPGGSILPGVRRNRAPGPGGERHEVGGGRGRDVDRSWMCE